MKPLTIVFVGNYRVPWCSEVHFLKSLESLGHEVVALQEDEIENDQILAVCDGLKPDLFLWTHTWQWGKIDAALLKALPCPSAYYHLDLVRGIPDRESRVDTSAQYRCDYCFMPDGDESSVAWFKEHGVNYLYSPPAVYHEGCYLAEPDPTQGNEIIFVGARGEQYHPQWPYRKELLERLGKRYGSRFTIYDHSSQMREHRLNVLYASSKVVVGDSFNPDFSRSLYTSDRIFECAGRGGGAQVYPRINGLEQYLEDGKEILFYDYNDWDCLFSKIDWLLEHDQEREEMRLAAMLRTQKEHTYRHRMENMLSVIFEGKENQYQTELNP